MTVYLRRAGMKDAPTLSKIGDSFYRAHFRQWWISESEMGEFLASEYALPAVEKSLADPGVYWLLAQTDSPVGFAKITWDSAIVDTGIAGVLLNKLYLSPDATGKHYGKQIFDKVIKLAQTRGESFLWLEVLAQNERAIKFYDRQGLQHIKDEIFESASQQSIVRIMGMPI